MEKVLEFKIQDITLKEYLEDCMIEKNIQYEIKIEDRWTQQYKHPQYYQVYCLYVNESNFDKIKQFMKAYENATIITDDIAEL